MHLIGLMVEKGEMTNILVVDDEKQIPRLVNWTPSKIGYLFTHGHEKNSTGFSARFCVFLR